MTGPHNSAIRILVVDDEESIRRSLCAFLEDYDYEVTPADSAEKALKILEHISYDAAVVDLRLPAMSGDVMILHAHKLCPDMKFIIHTGSVTYRLTDDLKIIGMKQEQVLLKPLRDLMIVIDTLETLLDGRTP